MGPGVTARGRTFPGSYSDNLYPQQYTRMRHRNAGMAATRVLLRQRLPEDVVSIIMYHAQLYPCHVCQRRCVPLDSTPGTFAFCSRRCYLTP